MLSVLYIIVEVSGLLSAVGLYLVPAAYSKFQPAKIVTVSAIYNATQNCSLARSITPHMYVANKMD